MNVEAPEASVSRIAGAIAEPARARMLCLLLDGRARTATELAVAAEVTPSTASVHLAKLRERGLVEVAAQGKHRYYRLGGPAVAAAIEALMIAAGGAGKPWRPSAPAGLTAARTCYDHMAGALGVSLHDRIVESGWLVQRPADGYDLTDAGTKALEAAGVDLAGSRALRRRFAFPCLDWSERRPHVGGALGAALLGLALRRKWVVRELDGRALDVTRAGRRELRARFGLREWGEPRFENAGRLG
ncbi:MAG TPA: helix-turn-helix transcriptional regulator [Thermoanaerobaculia bacterium]|nr:helix-turn-helix transcriptional regulator [Thermoanaerobaculia bacterium]